MQEAISFVFQVAEGGLHFLKKKAVSKNVLRQLIPQRLVVTVEFSSPAGLPVASCPVLHKFY
ncbi:MAG: hypothetical protein WCR50_06095, partial [Proteiniphilum sp.]